MMQRPAILLSATLLLTLLSISPLYAAQAQLSWTAPTTNANGTPLKDLAGYKVYYGQASRKYGAPINIGNKTSYTVSGLTSGVRYYFAVTAYDTSRNESAFSTEVSFTPPPGSALTGPVAAYSFSEGSGTKVADASGHGHTGTITGATWTTQGKYGNALSFDGVNDYVQAANSSLLNITGNKITLSAWLYNVNNGQWHTAIAKPVSVTSYQYYAYGVTVSPSGTFRFRLIINGQGRYIDAPSTFNAWHHVAGTYDGAKMRLYIDGVERASGLFSGNISGYNTPLRIGINGGMWGPWRGRIDDVRIYNRALTASEVKTVMSTPVTSKALVAAAPQVANTMQVPPDGDDAINLDAVGVPIGSDGRRATSTSPAQKASDTLAAASQSLRSDHLEGGEVVVDQHWTQVQFSKPFTNPVVVAKALSYQDAAPAVVHIRRVTPSGFELRLQAWGDAEGPHAAETVGYLVLERGRYTLADGTAVESGTVDVDPPHPQASLAFSQPFRVAPVVLTAVSEAEDAVTGQPGQVSKHGFQFRLQGRPPELRRDAPATVSYIAWEPTSGMLDGLTFEVGRTLQIGREQFHAIRFRERFVDVPVFLADIQATKGNHALNPRWERKNVDGVEVKIDAALSQSGSPAPDFDVVGYISFR